MLSLVASLPLFALAPSMPAPQPTAAPAQDDLTAEYEQRRAAAEGDKDALWKLVDWCEANSLNKQKRSCLRAILKLDDGDKKAHELLGHVLYDGQWFTSKRKLERFKKEQAKKRLAEEEKLAKENGWVRYKDRWVPPEDVKFLERGWEKDEDGRWVDPEEKQKLADGWIRQDSTWIAPDEIPQVEQGLWKCGEEWLTLDKADEYHAKLGQWWQIPTDHFVVYTTLPRKVALEACGEIEQAYREFVRALGRAPLVSPHMFIANSVDQYSAFVTGDWSRDAQGVDTQGFSSIHGAFFADAWFDLEKKVFMGAGVCYWDYTTEGGNRFGKTYARHAAGQSFVEAIDPSTETIGKVFSTSSPRLDVDAFWKEKRIPRWFRYGVAAYGERYYVDSTPGEPNPRWPLKWSVSNILNRGGLDPLDDVFRLDLRLDGKNDSSKLINEAGLVVAFILDGDCAPLKQKHAEVKALLKKNDDKALRNAFAELAALVKQNEHQLRLFAEL